MALKGGSGYENQARTVSASLLVDEIQKQTMCESKELLAQSAELCTAHLLRLCLLVMCLLDSFREHCFDMPRSSATSWFIWQTGKIPLLLSHQNIDLLLPWKLFRAEPVESMRTSKLASCLRSSSWASRMAESLNTALGICNVWQQIGGLVVKAPELSQDQGLKLSVLQSTPTNTQTAVYLSRPTLWTSTP